VRRDDPEGSAVATFDADREAFFEPDGGTESARIN
jgi:hypothetical protein